MILVLSGPGERDVELGDVATEDPGGGFGTAGRVSSGEQVLLELEVRQLGRTDQGPDRLG